ncbi:hypothetical protein BC826DRAFT_1107042 [Russula brevipes]|nr:hypothetical protein BC826DRAFT_1107042 [Russula brevipes]
MASGTSGAAGKATDPQSPDAIGGSPQMQIHAEDVSSPQHSQTRGGDVSNPQVAQMREGDVPNPRETQMREGEPQSMPERQEEAMADSERDSCLEPSTHANASGGSHTRPSSVTLVQGRFKFSV